MPPSAASLERGQFVTLCYRLACRKATGGLALELDDGKPELLIIRRGQLFVRSSDALGREISQRMERLATAARRAHFSEGLPAYPPCLGRPFSLSQWARTHLEKQIDSPRAQELVRELAGARLVIVPEHLPDVADFEPADLRIIEAMRRPRRLDQIWPMARTPRFRLLCFVHFLRAVGAVTEQGVASSSRPMIGSKGRQQEAMKALGLSQLDDPRELKRAYRQLVRQLHPDLNGSQSPGQQRYFERKLADINSAYRELTKA